LCEALEKEIDKLKEVILSIKKEYKEATDSGKPFYITKEMLQRLKLAQNELKELKALVKTKSFKKY